MTITLSSCLKEKNCTEFITGTFAYATQHQSVKIVRNDTMQIESNSETGVEIYTSIEWKSPCSYILTYVKILNHPEDMSDAIGRKINVKILETDRDRFKVHVKSEFTDELIEFIKVE